MPNRRLSAAELHTANDLLAKVRKELEHLSDGDADLLFALRRKVAKELVYDERDKPMIRRALKRKMRGLQDGICPLCHEQLPETYCVLDRFNAGDSYVETNVRLICEPCDRRIQRERGYT
jgi:hypothetical protein